MWAEERSGHLYIRIRVQPRSSRNEMAGIQGDFLKVRLTSPPVEGAANSHLIEFMSRRLGIPKYKIEIESGERARGKTLRIEGVTKKEFMETFGIS